MDELRKAIFQDISELKCGDCKKYLSVPPITYSPSSKEYMCGRCQPTLDEKDKSDGFQRQFLYEECAKYMEFPCSYRVIGCQAEVKWGDVIEHENSCLFRNSVCPLYGNHKSFLSLKKTCNWRGNSHQLTPHILGSHWDKLVNPPQITLKPTFETSYFFTEVFQQVMMVIFKYNKDEDKFNIFVLANLSDVECNFFRYQLEVSNDSNSSVVLRRPRIDPLCDNIFKYMTNRGGLEVDIKAMTEMLSNATTFYVKVSITKKNRKELRVLQSSLPPNSVLSPSIKDRALIVDEAVLIELECPVCSDIMVPPILMCEAGHSVCNNCNSKVFCCPSCRGVMTNTRNYSLEKLTNRLNYPCKNRSTGCFFITSSEKIRSHEKTCSLTSKKCILNCNWEGNSIDMIIHLNEKHEILNLNNVKTICLNPLKNTTYEAIVFDNEVFLLTITVGYKLHFQYSLQCLGSYIKYKFEIQIIDRTGNDLNILLRHLCSPFSNKEERETDKLEEIKQNYRLPYDLIETLVFERKELDLKIKIMKVNLSRQKNSS